MLPSEIWTELASTDMNVYNVCELTSKRLPTDWPETFVKRPLAKRLVGEMTDIRFCTTSEITPSQAKC